MAIYQSSSFYAKLIKQKYDRLPYTYPQQGKQEYEDHEYIRSFAYENGDMNYLTTLSNRRLKHKGVKPIISGENVNSVMRVDEHGAIRGGK